MKCSEIMGQLELLSPKKYACDWDNVGLLVGRKEKEIRKIMIALDASNEAVQCAVEKNVDMLITHHPMIFSAIKQVNEENFVTEKVLTLVEYGICYYAMHTNFDAVGGMAELAAGERYLNLTETKPIESGEEPNVGMGRYGILPEPMTVEQIAEYVKKQFRIPFVSVYQSKANRDAVYSRIAVMPGSGKSDMKRVVRAGYEIYLTGDIGHHEGLDAVDMGLTVIDATHYGLEHIFIEYIHSYLDKVCCGVDIIEYDQGCPVRIV